MDNKKLKLITIILTIIFVISGTLLFIDIQIIETPETKINIEVIEISADEAIVNAEIDIYNPNGFGLVVRDLLIIVTTIDNAEVSRIFIEGGDIPPHKSKTFNSTAILALNDNNPENLISKITGTIGINSGILQKTIPLCLIITTSLENFIKDLDAPRIKINVDFDEITQEGVNLTGVIDIYNPNSFDLIIEKISAEIITEKGEKVGSLLVEESEIKAKESIKLNVEAGIQIDALNAEILKIILNADAGVKAAGYKKTITFGVETEIKVPSIGSIINLNEPTFAVIKGDYKISLRGLIDKVTFEVYNPNKIDVEIKDIVVSLYRIDSNNKILLAEGEIEDGIVEADSQRLYKGEIIIPYSKFIPPSGGRLIPEAIEIVLTANVTVAGLDEYIWVGVSGYQDLRFFK